MTIISAQPFIEGFCCSLAFWSTLNMTIWRLYTCAHTEQTWLNKTTQMIVMLKITFISHSQWHHGRGECETETQIKFNYLFYHILITQTLFFLSTGEASLLILSFCLIYKLIKWIIIVLIAFLQSHINCISYKEGEKNPFGQWNDTLHILLHIWSLIRSNHL